MEKLGDTRLTGCLRKPRILAFADRLLATLGLVAAVVAWFVVITRAQGFDAHAYWIVNAADPYAIPYGAPDAFSYSPAAAQVFQLVRALPFPVFYALWTAMLIGIILWLLPPRWWALGMLGALLELALGNVHLVIAAALVLAYTRASAWWSVPILLKATPVVGLIWHVFRREWRQLAEAAGVTIAIAGVSFLIAPMLWGEWLGFLAAAGPAETLPSRLLDARIGIPLIVRLPAAVVLVAYAARSDRRWLVPVGVVLAMPSFWITAAVLLYAIPRLQRADREAHALERSQPRGDADPRPFAAAGDSTTG